MLRLSSYLLLLMLFLTACTSNNKSEQKIGEDGFPEFSEEQMQEMINNHPQAQQQKQSLEASESQIIQKMETFLANNPADLSTNYNLAKLYYQKYMKDSLIDACKKAIPLYSNVINLQADYEEGRSYYNRMLCYLNTNEYEAALSDLDRFIAINQDRTPVNYESMRAEILFQKGNQEAACKAYTRALLRYEKDSLPIHNQDLWSKRCEN